MATVEVKPLSGETTKEVIVDVKSVILSEMSKEIENHAKSVDGDEKEAECHPLHKMSDYKSHVWNQVAQQLPWSGAGAQMASYAWIVMYAFERSTRPALRSSKGDKWYYYYKKMSFLDPYIEHRNRRKRGDLMTSLMKLGGNAEGLFDPQITERNDEEEASDSGEGEIEDRCDPLKEFYASFAEQSMAMPLPIDVELLRGSSGKKRKLEEVHEEDVGDTEVSLFVRSIEKSLSGMDARTFALARLEISRVLFDCQYGDRKLV
ncbi:hypothetical protein OSTOST_11416, partial [Ostertagia ostertagi]